MENRNRIKSLRESLDSIVEKWKSRTPVFSGATRDSITPLLNYAPDGDFVVNIFTNPTFDYINEGVDGTEVRRGSRFAFKEKKPPISSLAPWAASKGIPVWALQNSLYKKGIRPRNITEGIEEDLLELENRYMDAMEKDLDETLDEMLKDKF